MRSTNGDWMVVLDKSNLRCLLAGKMAKNGNMKVPLCTLPDGQACWIATDYLVLNKEHFRLINSKVSPPNCHFSVKFSASNNEISKSRTCN